MFHIFTLMCSYTIVRLLACKHDKLQCHFDVKTLDVKAFLHNVNLLAKHFITKLTKNVERCDLNQHLRLTMSITPFRFHCSVFSFYISSWPITAKARTKKHV